jgi:hypothetical protein
MHIPKLKMPIQPWYGCTEHGEGGQDICCSGERQVEKSYEWTFSPFVISVVRSKFKQRRLSLTYIGFYIYGLSRPYTQLTEPLVDNLPDHHLPTMSVSPSPERIEICTPPDSPDIVFDDNEQDWSPIDVAFTLTSNGPITPVRNPRGVVPRRRFKRKRVDSADATSIAKPSNDHGTGSPETSKEYSAGSESVQRHDENLSSVLDLAASTSPISNTTGLDLAAEEMDNFEHYVNAALADCAGFFQISKQLFVVQGWDEKWQRSTVGRQNTGTQATSLCTNGDIISSRRGTTFSVFGLGKSVVWCALALMDSRTRVCTSTFYNNTRERCFQTMTPEC